MFPNATLRQTIELLVKQGRYRLGAGSPFEIQKAQNKLALGQTPSAEMITRLSLPEQMAAFQAQWDTMMQALGGPLVPMAINSMRRVTDLIKDIGQFSAVHPDLMKAIGAELSAVAVGLVALGSVAVVAAVAGMIGPAGWLAMLAIAIATFTYAAITTPGAMIELRDSVTGFFTHLRDEAEKFKTGAYDFHISMPDAEGFGKASVEFAVGYAKFMWNIKQTIMDSWVLFIEGVGIGLFNVGKDLTNGYVSMVKQSVKDAIALFPDAFQGFAMGIVKAIINALLAQIGLRVSLIDPATVTRPGPQQQSVFPDAATVKKFALGAAELLLPAPASDLIKLLRPAPAVTASPAYQVAPFAAAVNSSTPPLRSKPDWDEWNNAAPAPPTTYGSLLKFFNRSDTPASSSAIPLTQHDREIHLHNTRARRPRARQELTSAFHRHGRWTNTRFATA